MERPDFKALIAELKSDELTVKRQGFILNIIAAEVDKIWREVCQLSHRKIDWWAFSNDVENEGRGNGSDGGHFDEENDKDFIEIIGQSAWHKNKYYEYNEGIPTSFLWEDYEKIIRQHLIDIEQKLLDEQKKTVEKSASKKAKKEELLKSIRSKLTPEELKFLKIKEKNHEKKKGVSRKS